MQIGIDSGKWYCQPEASDFEWLIKHLKGEATTPYINYSPEHAKSAYENISLRLIHNGDETVSVPYEVLFDYTTAEIETGWGRVFFNEEPYIFPRALEKHKAAMRHDFERRNLLSKGNQPCPRVERFEVFNGTPQFLLQAARYYDQVGSNLSIDYPLADPVTIRRRECKTVREWDVVQAHWGKDLLPTFEESRLANTIGVAIGVSARSKDGQTHWLRRKRSKNVAVYANQWHVPFSFALSLDERSRKATDLQSLLDFDFIDERREEFGILEHSHFGALKPIAFCRDLARGGKPQFFLELPCFVPFEELRARVQDSNETPEFSGKLEQVSNNDEESSYSNELLCLLLLTADRSGSRWR